MKQNKVDEQFIDIYDRGAKNDRLVMSKFSGGPKGLGDPNDKTLIALEKEIYIPRIINKECNNKCLDYIKELDKCAIRKGGIMIFFCRQERARFRKCIVDCYDDKHITSKCAQQYLDKRSEYRRTGITDKEKATKPVSPEILKHLRETK